MKCKNAVLFLVIGIFMTASSFSQVGIGTTNPNASSGLDVDYTDKGLLPPRMTTVQRNAISNPADGLIIFNITTGSLNYFHSNAWYELFGILSGSISSLDCINAIIEGTLTEGVVATGVSAIVHYTGGNGQYYAGQTVNSTEVSGLTATLDPGGFNVGSGALTYTIAGTPVSSGTATFELNVGGQTCILEIPVAEPFNCGTSTVTFNYNGSSVTYSTVMSAGRCWLDRNLGATQVATNPNDAAAYGHLFQWGRLDDGHQVRTSPTTTTLSSGDVPGHGDFILAPASPFDWRSPQNPNLWQGVNGINNPCPSGFRLPIEAEWQTEISSWTIGNAAGAFASPLKLTLTALRDGSNGTIFAENVHGTYWSHTVSGTDSRRLGFDSNFVGIFTSNRNIGQSVRCIKD
jgi:uncharacterized protein (TIGR02145 family)